MLLHEQSQAGTDRAVKEGWCAGVLAVSVSVYGIAAVVQTLLLLLGLNMSGAGIRPGAVGLDCAALTKLDSVCSEGADILTWLNTDSLMNSYGLI
jgi:hypothetical protein